MQEFSFWPTSAPRKLGGVFELRSYTLNPGSLLEWESHWRTGLDARKKVMEVRQTDGTIAYVEKADDPWQGVGAWFCQIGDLNTVHHLWQFADLEERRARREQSWVQPGWVSGASSFLPLVSDC